MNKEIRTISYKILEYLSSEDADFRANNLVDCAGEDELPIILVGLIDRDPSVRMIAADVIGAEPHNFIAAAEVLKKLYLKEEYDEVKINILGTLKKWDNKDIYGRDIEKEFQSILSGHDLDFVNWARLKFGMESE